MGVASTGNYSGNVPSPKLAGAASYYTIEAPTQQLRHLFDRAGRLAERYPDQQDKG